MREDLLEALEKLFPDGFLIVYPVAGGKSVRMQFVAEKETEACEQIHRIFNAVKSAEIRDEERN